MPRTSTAAGGPDDGRHLGPKTDQGASAFRKLEHWFAVGDGLRDVLAEK